MRTPSWLGCAATLLLLPAALHAQTCDVMITNGSWSVHPDPDSIYVSYNPEITSDAPQNPRLYEVRINIRFNSVLVDQQDATLQWSHGYQCASNCPPDICAEKEWLLKGALKRVQTRCAKASPTFCYCPVPVLPKEKKPIPKPTGSGLIEIEMVPLDLQGCNPINPGNDRVQFAYPGAGPTPTTPGAPPALVLSLVMGFVGVALVSLRMRRRAA